MNRTVAGKPPNGPSGRRRGCAVRAFCPRQNLGAGAALPPRALKSRRAERAFGPRSPQKRTRLTSCPFLCLLLPKKIQPGKPCGSMDSGFCATCVFVFLRFFQAISEPLYDILTKPCANRGEKRAVRQHSPLSYFSLMICSYSMAYLFSITILL